MIESSAFLKSVLDTITEHVVVIDQNGNIQYVNRSWVQFGLNNNCLMGNLWEDINYLAVCEKSAAMGDEYGLKAGEGIKKIIAGEQESFYFEYPCHSPTELRWFIMRVTSFPLEENVYYVISHQNITERKLAEEKVLSLSRLDGLTNIANRRYFDEFFHSEWERCVRLNMPISLAIIDVDYFKLLNDAYGHLAGDECLKKIADTLKMFARRPGDICARYGGEEFAMVFGNLGIDVSLDIINKLLDVIRELKIPNERSPILPTITVSIGLAAMYPRDQIDEKQLITVADKLLYVAKESGRNRIVYQYEDGI